LHNDAQKISAAWFANDYANRYIWRDELKMCEIAFPRRPHDRKN
jgi:hypothetical protein